MASAQNEPLEKRTTLQMQEEPLENILTILSKETGVRFSYNSQLVNPKTKVTINIQDKTIEDVLSIILPSTISYKKVGEHIVFFSEKVETENTEGEKQKAESNDDEMIETGKEVDGWTLSEIEMEVEQNVFFEKNTYPNNGITTNSCLDTVSLTKNEDMKAQIAGLMLAAATATTPIIAQDTHETNSVQNAEMQQQTNCKPFQFTFIYPLGTEFTKAVENCYHVSLNMLGGVTGETKGFEAGGLFNINRYGNIGAQFAGLFNVAGTKKSDISSYNVQFAGLFNHTKRGISVVQYAGLFNTGDTTYFQAAGLFNIANKAGFQASGLFNVSKESYCQLAGLFNQGGIAHFQAAGLWNSAKETKCQLAGLVNVAQESYCQIAGLVNVTKKGRFQMGIINVRDTADGVSLGLINIVKKGGILEAGIEAGELIHTAVTFRSGVKQLYSIIFVGCNFGSTRMTWASGAGLGTSITLIKNLSLNFELTHATFFPFRSGTNWVTFTQFRPVLNYRFAKHFKMYVGPTLNLFQETERFWGSVPSSPKVPYSFFHRSYNSTTLDMWVGVVGGIKF